MIRIYTFFSFYSFIICVYLDCQIDVEEGMQMPRSQRQLLTQNLLGEIAGLQGHWRSPDEAVNHRFLNSFVKHIMICPSAALTRFDVECVLTGTVKPRPSSPKRVAAATTASHANCWRCSCVGSRTTSPVSRSWCFSTLRQTTARRTRRRGRWVSSAGGVIEPQQVNWQININIKGDFRSLLYMVWRTSSGGLQTLFSLFCNRCWWLQPALLWTGVQHPPVQPRLPPVQLQVPLVLRSQVPDLHHQERRVHLQIKLRELFTRRLYNLGLINLW